MIGAFINILFVTHYSELYGANRSLLNLIDGLIKDHKCSISVICRYDGPLVKELNKRNIPFEIMKFNLNIESGETSFFKSILNACEDIKRAMSFVFKKERSYDLVYTNTSVTNFGFLVSLLLRKKHVFHIREFGDLDYNLSRRFPSMFTLCLNFSARVICISESIKKHYSVSKAVVIYNGVISKIPTKARITRDRLIVGIVGVLREEKGVREALSGLISWPTNSKIIDIQIFGDGKEKYRDECLNLIKNKESITFKFNGFVEDIEKIYSKFDILIVPSYFEALGRVTMEGMCFGIPVIGRNSAGTKELIDNDINGYLYEKDSELINLIFKIDADYERMSKNAKEKASNEFLQARYCELVYNNIVQLVNE